MIGILVAIVSFVYGAFILYNRLIGNVSVEGWTATMIVVTFTAGLQMIMIGVVGEYLWRALDQARQRPSYVIDEVL